MRFGGGGKSTYGMFPETFLSPIFCCFGECVVPGKSGGVVQGAVVVCYS
jgi:hypothetical protein